MSLASVRSLIRAGRLDEAEAAAGFDHAADQGSVAANAAVGAVLMARSDPAGARPFLEIARPMLPVDPELARDYGLALFYTDDRPGGVEALRSALDRFPSDWSVLETYRAMLRLCGQPDMTAREVFEHIYRHDLWKGGSGEGSTPERTASYRAFVTSFIRNNGVRSILDAGCGDWQFSRFMDFGGADYLGVDLVEPVIARLRPYESVRVKFQVADFSRDDLPPADLLLMKDVLQHCSNETIHRMLPRFGRYKFVLITNGFPAETLHALNLDIPDGDCRPIDLTRAPFSIPGTYVFEFTAEGLKRVFLVGSV